MRIQASSDFSQAISRRELSTRRDAVIGERNENKATVARDDQEQQRQTSFATSTDNIGSINSPFAAHGSKLYRLDDALANIPPRNRPAVITYLGIQVSRDSFPAEGELVGVDLFV